MQQGWYGRFPPATWTWDLGWTLILVVTSRKINRINTHRGSAHVLYTNPRLNVRDGWGNAGRTGLHSTLKFNIFFFNEGAAVKRNFVPPLHDSVWFFISVTQIFTEKTRSTTKKKYNHPPNFWNNSFLQLLNLMQNLNIVETSIFPELFVSSPEEKYIWESVSRPAAG